MRGFTGAEIFRVGNKSTTCDCLILACGNTLRGDDGVGPWLASWAEQRFADDPRVRVKTQMQWTPELAEEVTACSAVIFVDCSATASPGEIELNEVQAASGDSTAGTHHLDAGQLLALSLELYGRAPASAQMLSVGAGSTELGEGFSEPVKAALPQACATLEQAAMRALDRCS